MEQAALEPYAVSKKLIFKHFPAYARYIREHHLAEYSRYQIRLARELDVPLMRIFAGMADEQILEYARESHVEFLLAAEENRLEEIIRASMKRWLSDQLEIVGRNEIETDDITKVGYIRKKALLKFLPLFTDDASLMLEIVAEFDTFQLEADTSGLKTYVDILKQRITEHNHFIESLTNTSPGIVYAFDLEERREIYLNEKAGEILGYLPEEMHSMGDNIMPHLMHPEDLEGAAAHLRDFSEAKDGDVLSFEYRVKTKSGAYCWMRAYESVFKRDNAGKPVQIIGVAFEISEEKSRSEALQHSQALLLEAQEIADLGSFEMSFDPKKIEVSPRLMKVLDLAHTGDFEYFINKVHPADRQKVKEAMDEAYATGKYECEYRLLTSDNQEKVIWSRGFMTFGNGKPVSFKGTVMDVTEKHHMIRRWQRSDELYKQAQAMTRIGNWAWDLILNKLTWSDELYRIYGLEPGAEISYDLIASFNHEQDAERVQETMKKALERLEPFNFFYRIILRNGSVRIVQAKGEVRTDNGKPYKLIGTVQDVTEQQLVEQQLRENREFIQKIANTTPSIIASYNINTGKYTFINNALYTILGHDPQDVLDQGVAFFLDIIHPDDIVAITEENSRALELANENPPVDGNEMTVEFKYRLRHKNGQYRWFHTYGTIFDRNKKGRVEHVLNVSVDITEQEEGERTLHQKNIELQQSNASLEEYAYVASHDLKEPLRKIATFTDRLLTTQQERLSEEGKLYLHKILDSSRRMQTMISDLLAVSVISGNKSFEVYSLKDVLQDVLRTLEYKIEEKKAEVTADELPLARIVPSQFRQLFQNLISNSLKFSRKDITPRIRISHSYLYPWQVEGYEVAKANKFLKIEVADNGIGFDNQFTSKIFTIFQRLVGKTEYEGTGIGLAICKKIAENHGGTIVANGLVNHGATFTIILPV